MLFLKTNEEIVRELGQRARRRRLERRISQQDVAAKAGVHTNTVRALEAGKDIRLHSLVGILRALGGAGDIDAVLARQIPVRLDVAEEPLPQRIRKRK